MIKIYFTCDWQDNNNLTLNTNKITPNNKGFWKNLKSTTNIEEADYVVCLNKPIKRVKKEKIIVFLREPRVFYNPKFNEKNFFTYDDIHHVFTYPCFIQKTYDELKGLGYDTVEKNKLLSTITSHKLHTRCSKKRVEFIKKFNSKYPENIDIYGNGWNNNMENYKGSLGCYHSRNGQNTTKYDGLKNYKYSLCFENSSEKNYFSEKFTDCILSWTIPIYFGCTNIEEYFPEDSYYLVDIFDDNSLDKVKEIISKPITEKNIKALEKARELILEKYNIWGVLEKII